MPDIHFPDGSLVRAAGLQERAVEAAWRGHGLYLDVRWAPTWPAEVLDWPDLGTPTDDRGAAAAIRRTHRLARSGVHVEVGCLAGRGRTGTVLACIATLAGIPAEDAVAWVRRRLPGAVETSAQEAWVLHFASGAFDGPMQDEAVTEDPSGASTDQAQ